jgi:hypothetical protein
MNTILRLEKQEAKKFFWGIGDTQKNAFMLD